MKNNFIKDRLILCNNLASEKVAIRQENRQRINEITYSELYNRITEYEDLLANFNNKVVVLYLTTTIESYVLLYSCFYYNIIPIIRTYDNEYFDKEKLEKDFKEICKHYSNVYAGFILYQSIKLNFSNEIIKNEKYFDNEELYDIAFIQFSSGTTGYPKGIKTSYGSLYNNLIKCSSTWNVDKFSKILSWLPISHCFGFLVGVLLPIFTMSENIIISPKTFYTNPIFLLQLMSDYKISHTFMPNFALEHIRRTFKVNETVKVDLTNLKVLGIGGDFITKEIVEQFYNMFHKFNLRKNVLKSVYGMSENCGIITTTKFNNEINFYDLNDQIKNIKFNGFSFPIDNTEVANVGNIFTGDEIIIKAKSKFIVDELNIGEIYINTNSLFSGYLNDSLKENINDTICYINGSKYFKTGDIGFKYNNNLYIIGRVKDIIVIRGKNFSSNIIEKNIAKKIELESSAISVASLNNDEVIYVIVDFKSKKLSERKELIINIKNSFKNDYDFEIDEKNILIGENIIPRTNTNKINRQECKNIISKVIK